MAKQRLDVVLVEHGLAESRQKAQGLIMAGKVYYKEQKLAKAGHPISLEEIPHLVVRGNPLPFVSRGGLKLQKAVDSFSLALEGLTCADIGSSTGGFTDCMLQQGASYVYAVDSGYNQLDWKLRNHPQVCSLERTNARYLTTTEIPNPLDFFSVDVSFISLRHILPPIKPLLKEGGEGVCLIKPQFEAGRESVGKKGVVRDRAVHERVIEQFYTHAEQSEFLVKEITYSPIKGPEGNIEYLAYITTIPGDYPKMDIQNLVAQSHTIGKEGQDEGHS
ncbi:MAG: TlyA family RNA methyltransferase [Eubacteriales bacterium]